MDETRRKNYWDKEYFDYWKKRIDEANIKKEGAGSDVVQKDFKVPSDLIYEKILKETIVEPGKLLDVGCGWGRMFDFYASMGMQIYGVDISQKMIEEARKSRLPQLVEVIEATAESLPYEDNYFDYLTCFGVFDATYQEKTLSQFIRVLRENGRLFITGKNDNYFPDDEEAMLAEFGARRKGEPNYFSNVNAMVDQLEKNGHRILKGLYFERRGDFGKEKYLTEMPEKFYEYFLSIEKRSIKRDFEKIAHESSIVSKSMGKT